MLHDLSEMNLIEARAFVFSLMIFPEQDQKTLRAYYYYYISGVADLIPEEGSKSTAMKRAYTFFGDSVANAVANNGGVETFISTVFNGSKPIEDMIEQRVFKGEIVGRLFHHIVNNNMNISESIGNFSDALKAYEQQGGELPCAMSYSNFKNNIWNLFRPVAHLWAAAHEVAEINKKAMPQTKNTQINAIDCYHMKEMGCPDGLPGFLLIADICRKQGAKVKLSRRGPSGPFFDLESSHDFKQPWGLTYKQPNWK